jgi:hypothetical protein
MMNTSADPSNSRLRVRRFHGNYLLDANHPAPERVKAALDETIARGLPARLAAALVDSLPCSDPGLWFIRRLTIDVGVNVAWDREVLTARLAEQLARELVDTIRSGADGRDVIRFADRKEYLARFLADRAAGQGEAWYYDTFDGLRLLPVSAALRTAILDTLETGLAALLHLPTDERQRVVTVLTIQDARRVLEVFADGAPAGDRAACLAAAWSARHRLGPAALGGEEERAALLLYLAALEPGRVEGLPLADATRGLIRLLGLLRSERPQSAARLLTALTQGDQADLYRAVGTSNAEVLAPLCAGRPEWLRDLLASGSPGVQPQTLAAATSDGARHTPFGGAFFLLPRLDELPLNEATAGWPNLGSTSAAALARFLILVKCFGAERAEAAFRDPLLRDLMTIDPDVGAESLTPWQAQLTRDARNQFLEQIEQGYIDRGAIRLETQFLLRSGSEERPVAVLLDGARGQWRRIAGARPSLHREGLIRQFIGLLERTQPGNRLFGDAEYIEPLRARFDSLRVLDLPNVVAPEGPGADTGLCNVVSRLDHLADDLQYLSLRRALGIGSALDRVLAVAAQGVLRSFAWRLPGFSLGHLAYLHANFLDIHASVEEQPDRRVVRLGRPPLGLILNMTGANRGTYQVGWLDTKPFALFPEP